MKPTHRRATYLAGATVLIAVLAALAWQGLLGDDPSANTVDRLRAAIDTTLDGGATDIEQVTTVRNQLGVGTVTTEGSVNGSRYAIETVVRQPTGTAVSLRVRSDGDQVWLTSDDPDFRAALGIEDGWAAIALDDARRLDRLDPDLSQLLLPLEIARRVDDVESHDGVLSFTIDQEAAPAVVGVGLLEALVGSVDDRTVVTGTAHLEGDLIETVELTALGPGPDGGLPGLTTIATMLTPAPDPEITEPASVTTVDGDALDAALRQLLG